MGKLAVVSLGAWLASVLLVPCVSAAQDEQAAMRLTLEAQQHYRAGEVDRAIVLLEEALALREEAVIVFNLGTALELRGDHRRAAAQFSRYLELAPDAADRGAVERRLAAIQARLRSTEEARSAEQEAGRRLAEAERRAEQGPWPYLLGALSGAVVVSSAVFAGVAHDTASSVPAEADHRTASGALREAEDFALVANLGFGLGAALFVSAVVWWVVQLTEGESSAPPPAHAAYRQRVSW